MRIALACLALLARCLRLSDSGHGARAVARTSISAVHAQDGGQQAVPVAFADSSLVSAAACRHRDSGWTQTSIVHYMAGGQPAGDTLCSVAPGPSTGSNSPLRRGSSRRRTRARSRRRASISRRRPRPCSATRSSPDSRPARPPADRDRMTPPRCRSRTPGASARCSSTVSGASRTSSPPHRAA